MEYKIHRRLFYPDTSMGHLRLSICRLQCNFKTANRSNPQHMTAIRTKQLIHCIAVYIHPFQRHKRLNGTCKTTSSL